MVGAIAVEGIGAFGRNVSLGLDAPPHNQGSHEGCGAGLHPQGQLDSQLGAHPRAGRGVLQEEVHAQDPTDFGVAIELLIRARHGPGPAVGAEVPNRKGHVLPAKLLFHDLKSLTGVLQKEIQGPHGLFRCHARLLPHSRKVQRLKRQRDVTASHY